MLQPVLLTRRAALGAGLGAGLFLASGCQFGEDPAGAPAEPDPDLDLLAQVREEVTHRLAYVQRASERHIGLSPALGALEELHEAHLAVLVTTSASPSASPSADPTGSRVTVPRDSARALAEAVRLERTLQRRLASAAVAAESGTFARLLAGMSAAVAQVLTTLPGAAEGDA